MNDLPQLTSDLPKFQGSLKTEPDDFLVEEIPAYEPSGEGEHLFLWIEKKDLSADRLAAVLRQELCINRNDIGTAGLKDRRAITRQFVSVPTTVAEKVEKLNADGIAVLSAIRHGNKLKTLASVLHRRIRQSRLTWGQYPTF